MTKDEIMIAVGEFAEGIRKQLLGTSHAIKITSWSNKARHASIFLDFPDQDPHEVILKALLAEASERGLGETPDQLAEKQLSKASQFFIMSGTIDGMESKIEKAIKQAPDDATALAIFDAARAQAMERLAALGQSS